MDKSPYERLTPEQKQVVDRRAKTAAWTIQIGMTTMFILFAIFMFTHLTNGFHQDCTTTSTYIGQTSTSPAHYESHNECH